VYIDPLETNQQLQALENEFRQENHLTGSMPMQVKSSIPAPPVSPPQPPKSSLANEIKGQTIYLDSPRPELESPIVPPVSPMQPVPPVTPVPSAPFSQTPTFSSIPDSPSEPPAAVTPPPTKPKTDPSDRKTQRLYDDVEPVVGWLICLRGAYVGESFPLKPGQNCIGRSLHMDVPLLDEESVSRDTHSIIIFEPIHADFYVSNGRGNSLTYLNHNVVMQPEKLKSYDILRFGKCEYLFMPLCSDQFSWDTYIEK
jgi:hypothetical protein